VDLFTALAFAGTLVAFARNRAMGCASVLIPREFIVGTALFLGACLVSFFTTETPERSIVELGVYVVNLTIFGLVVLHLQSREDLRLAFRVWERATLYTAVIGILGVWFLFQGITDSLVTNGPKLAATFKKSGQLASYLLASLPILWFNLLYQSPRRGQRVARALLIAIVLSRTALLLAAGILAILFGIRWSLGILTDSRRFVAAATVAVLVPILIENLSLELPFAFRRAFSILERDQTLESMSQTRAYQWEGWQIAATEYPLTGVGVGDYRTRNTSLVPAAWKPHEVHSTYFGVWAESGIVGVVGLVLLTLAILRSCFQAAVRAPDTEAAALALAISAGVVALLFYSLSHFGLRMRYLWILSGFAVAVWNVSVRSSREKDSESERPIPAPWLAAPVGLCPADPPRRGRT
jgi:O-antigen ligase